MPVELHHIIFAIVMTFVLTSSTLLLLWHQRQVWLKEWRKPIEREWK